MDILDIMENNDICNKINKYTTEIKRNKKNFENVLWDIKMLNYSNDYYIKSWSPRDYFDYCYENEDTEEWFHHIKDCCQFLHTYRYSGDENCWCRKDFDYNWEKINQSIRNQ